MSARSPEAAQGRGFALSRSSNLSEGMAKANGRDVARALAAAREGDHETLRLLSTGRKAASAPVVLGEALRAAAESGHVDTLKALLQSGAPAAGAPGARGDCSTPLAAACARGLEDCAAVLLAYGAPVDAAPPPRHRTALHMACGDGHANCAALLIHHGAKLGLDNLFRATPLGVALIHGYTACATLLLDHGARAAADCLVGPGFDHGDASCWGLVPRLLAAGADADCRNRHGDTPLMLAALFGTSAAVRALCAVGADASAAHDNWRIPLYGVADSLFLERLDGSLVATLSEQIEKDLACTDELVERCGAKTLLTETRSDNNYSDNDSDNDSDSDLRILMLTALERGLYSLKDVSDTYSRNSVLQLRDGCLALMLARWPLSEPVPDYVEGVEALLPAAVGHAQRRIEVLRSGQGGEAVVQQALTAAFLRRVRDACGSAVAPAHAPFARFRFVAGGGLERAWAREREVHRFPVERERAALKVASDAQAAAAERCVPLLRELSAAGSCRRSSRREAGKLRDAVAVAVGRWGSIRAAVSHAEEGVRSAEAALDAAAAEAEAQVGRLQARAAAEEAAAAARAAAAPPVG